MPQVSRWPPDFRAHTTGYVHSVTGSIYKAQTVGLQYFGEQVGRSPNKDNDKVYEGDRCAALPLRNICIPTRGHGTLAGATAVSLQVWPQAVSGFGNFVSTMCAP